jgi:hypothetical protein
LKPPCWLLYCWLPGAVPNRVQFVCFAETSSEIMRDSVTCLIRQVLVFYLLITVPLASRLGTTYNLFRENIVPSLLYPTQPFYILPDWASSFVPPSITVLFAPGHRTTTYNPSFAKKSPQQSFPSTFPIRQVLISHRGFQHYYLQHTKPTHRTTHPLRSNRRPKSVSYPIRQVLVIYCGLPCCWIR